MSYEKHFQKFGAFFTKGYLYAYVQCMLIFVLYEGRVSHKTKINIRLKNPSVLCLIHACMLLLK